MKFLQINLGRAAHDVAMASANRESIDLLVMSEPNVRLAQGPGWITDKLGNAAFLIRNSNMSIKEYRKMESFVRLGLNDIVIHTCYISSNIPFTDFKKQPRSKPRMDKLSSRRIRKRSRLCGAPPRVTIEVNTCPNGWQLLT